MGPMQSLNGLNDRQREAAAHTTGPLLIIAGAGAGKTKTITHRIAHLIGTGVHPRQILAVTFTNKAAGEMRERVHKLLKDGHGAPMVATFHSLGVRLLREFHEEAGLPRSFVIWDRDDSNRCLKKALERLDVTEPTPRAALSVISRQKGDGVAQKEYAAKATHFRARTIAQVWETYDKALHEEGALDFDDLLARTLKLLQERPEVLSKLQNRWSHITIDEYQDTNASQYEIARLLAGEKRNLCVVGDIDQNIYSWRGADIEHLMSFEKSFPGTKTVLLEQNYRSTRTILTAANSVIAKNLRRKEKNLFTENETGEPIFLYPARNEVDEAYFIAATAAKLMEEGIPAKEIAVLYRESAQSRVIEEAFVRMGIEYRMLGTKFFDRKEVKDVVSYLRASLNPLSRVDLSRIIGTPPRGIGSVTLEKMLEGKEAELKGAALLKVQAFRDTLAKIKHAAETLPASEAVRYCIEASGIEAMLKDAKKEEDQERLGNVRELVNVATKYDDLPSPQGLEQLFEEAALQSEQDGLAEERAAVSLMTVHASKGLEFDAVFITGLEQGLFPSQREGGGDRDEEEERRLFYVAVTRARKRLFLSHAHDRMRYGQRERSLPSEFIGDIDQRLIVKPRPSLLGDGGEYVIR
ncbi:ATP-dependent DNA helicase PcrA [Candidatus Kaiserbacteria bacterium]|nr:ATP-dependent DNA helicase PcrA [Candidatus Kaiserbacteria bacterium]